MFLNLKFNVVALRPFLLPGRSKYVQSVSLTPKLAADPTYFFFSFLQYISTPSSSCECTISFWGYFKCPIEVCVSLNSRKSMREEIHWGWRIPSVEPCTVEWNGKSCCLLSYMSNLKILILLIWRCKLVTALARHFTDGSFRIRNEYSGWTWVVPIHLEGVCYSLLHHEN